VPPQPPERAPRTGPRTLRPMTAAGAPLRHTALVYDADDEYVGRAVPFLLEGLETGAGAVVAHTRSGLALMREALGADAAEVTFVDVGASYTRPARTLAAYHAVYAELLTRYPCVRAVADVQFGPEPREWPLWTGYEAVFNRAFAHLPAWVVCSYAGDRLPDPVREGVLRTHPELAGPDGFRPSEGFRSPEQVLRDLTPPPGPLPGLRTVPVDDDPAALRETLLRESAAEGVPPGRALDLVLAVTEVVGNAVRHGGGVAAVRVGRADGRFVCEVVDRGPGFDDPAAGYVPPHPGVGAGLWVARQLSWQVDHLRTADGFTTRIRL
jgi:anti-sigma regulatory factor (Ser/Thr protein kinase)